MGWDTQNVEEDIMELLNDSFILLKINYKGPLFVYSWHIFFK